MDYGSRQLGTGTMTKLVIGIPSQKDPTTLRCSFFSVQQQTYYVASALSSIVPLSVEAAGHLSLMKPCLKPSSRIFPSNSYRFESAIFRTLSSDSISQRPIALPRAHMKSSPNSSSCRRNNNRDVPTSTIRPHRDIPTWETHVRHRADINEHFIFA